MKSNISNNRWLALPTTNTIQIKRKRKDFDCMLDEAKQGNWIHLYGAVNLTGLIVNVMNDGVLLVIYQCRTHSHLYGKSLFLSEDLFNCFFINFLITKTQVPQRFSNYEG